ncbi:MAG: hypothetical protein WC817_02840 [Patescibacteria group bacterium]|jgi:hypothetical protein
MVASRSVPVIARSVIVELAYSPFWWYTIGLSLQFKRLAKALHYANESSGFSLWLKNLFVPMFGQNDFAGRTISFFMRVFQLCVRFVIYVCYVAWAVALFLLYIIVPPIILWKLAESTLNFIA